MLEVFAAIGKVGLLDVMGFGRRTGQDGFLGNNQRVLSSIILHIGDRRWELSPPPHYDQGVPLPSYKLGDLIPLKPYLNQNYGLP